MPKAAGISSSLNRDRTYDLSIMLFYLTCLYMLVFYIQPGSRIPALGALRFELVLGVIILVAVLATRSKYIFAPERITKAGIAFFVAICLSFIGAVQTHTATDSFEVFVNFIKSLSIYFMIIGTIDSEEKLEKFVWVYVLCMLILVGEPFLLSLQGKNLYAKERGIIRLYGVGQFAHPNGLGTHAVTTLPFLYFFFWHYQSKIVKGFLIGFALVCLRVIMLTASRTAYVGVLVFVFFVFLYSRKKLSFVLVALLLSSVLLTTVPSMYRNRFLSLKQVAGAVESDQRKDSSIGGRMALIRDAWNVFLDYPIFGCGMDSFRRLRGEDKEFNTYGQTHNLLLQILAETGLIGFLAFGYFLFSIWRGMNESRIAFSDSDGTNDYLPMLMMILQIFFLTKLTIGLLAQHSMYSRVWWIIAGLALVGSRILKERSQLGENAEGESMEIPTESYQYSQKPSLSSREKYLC